MSSTGPHLQQQQSRDLIAYGEKHPSPCSHDVRATAHLHLAALGWTAHVFSSQVPGRGSRCGLAHRAFLAEKENQQGTFFKALSPTFPYPRGVSPVAKFKVNEVVTQLSCKERNWRVGTALQATVREDIYAQLSLFQVLFQAFWWMPLLDHIDGKTEVG